MITAWIIIMVVLLIGAAYVCGAADGHKRLLNEIKRDTPDESKAWEVHFNVKVFRRMEVETLRDAWSVWNGDDHQQGTLVGVCKTGASVQTDGVEIGWVANADPEYDKKLRETIAEAHARADLLNGIGQAMGLENKVRRQLRAS